MAYFISEVMDDVYNTKDIEITTESSYFDTIEASFGKNGKALRKEINKLRAEAERYENDGKNNKAITNYKALKGTYEKLYSLYKKDVGNDNIIEWLVMLSITPAMYTGPIISHFHGTSVRDTVLAILDCNIQYCQYHIDKLSGKDVGLFKDYIIGAVKTLILGKKDFYK